jgi:hypothetical protein
MEMGLAPNVKRYNPTERSTPTEITRLIYVSEDFLYVIFSFPGPKKFEEFLIFSTDSTLYSSQ